MRIIQATGTLIQGSSEDESQDAVKGTSKTARSQARAVNQAPEQAVQMGTEVLRKLQEGCQGK